MKESHLFIGGCADGKDLIVSSNMDLFKVPHPMKTASFMEVMKGGDPLIETNEYDIYRRETFSTANKKWSIFIHTAMTTEDAFERMLFLYGRPLGKQILNESESTGGAK